MFRGGVPRSLGSSLEVETRIMCGFVPAEKWRFIGLLNGGEVLTVGDYSLFAESSYANVTSKREDRRSSKVGGSSPGLVAGIRRQERELLLLLLVVVVVVVVVV